MPQHSPLRPNAPLPAQRRPAPLPAPRRAPALHPPRPADLRSRPGAGVPFAATGAANGTAPVADPPQPSKLTINKIVAGAGAAATSAVAGSLFGAAGTVLGAALGSVVSTLAAAVYEHSLDRTRDTVKARIKLPGGRTVDVAGKVEVPAPRVAAGGETGQAHVYVTPAESTNRRRTMVLPSVSPASPARPRRRWVALSALALGVFLLGLLAVTGVELLKGSTLTRGETGTSVGRVVEPRPVSADPTEPTETGPTTTETAEPTETPATSTTESTTEATATESVTDESDGAAGRTGGGGTDAPERSSVDDEADVGATSAATPTPTPTRSPDGD